MFILGSTGDGPVKSIEVNDEIYEKWCSQFQVENDIIQIAKHGHFDYQFSIVFNCKIGKFQLYNFKTKESFEGNIDEISKVESEEISKSRNYLFHKSYELAKFSKEIGLY